MSRIVSNKILITAIFPVLSTIFYFSDIPASQSILISIFLTANGIAGLKLWEEFNKDAKLSFLPSIGIGSVLGIILSIFSIILSKKTNNSNIGLILPVLLWATLVLLTLPKRKKEKIQFSRVPKLDVLAITVALIPGSLYLVKWWTENPFKWSGFREFYTDLAFNEAIQNSLALHDSTKNLMILGGDIRYHWFTHLWTGAVTDVFKLDPFIAATRILPTIGLLSLSFIAFSFAKEVTNKTNMAIFSTVLITSGVGISYLTGDFYQKSPSLIFSQLILLTFTYMLYRTSEKNIDLKQCILLTILYLAAFGSKGSSGLVILGGLLMVLLINLIQNRIQIKTAGILGAILISSTFIIYNILFKGDSSLTFGIRLNWVPLALCVLLIAPGLLLSKNDFWTSRLIQFSAGTITTGIVLSLLFSNEDGSQNYFIFHIIAVTAIPSMVYISKIYPTFNSKKIFRKEILASLIFAIIALCLWIFGTLYQLKLIRGLAPLSIIVLSIFLSYIWRTSKHENKFIENFALLAATSVFAASYLSPIIYVMSPEKNRSSFQKINTNESIGMIDFSYKEAGAWVQENTPRNSIWATNRQCSSNVQDIRICRSDWFYASAFAGRQFLIEGAAFLSETNKNNLQANSRIDLSIEIGSNPTEKNMSQLLQYGITYLWIDKNIEYSEEIRKYGQSQYENQSILILRI
jgi:hypothetical protein